MISLGKSGVCEITVSLFQEKFITDLGGKVVFIVFARY
eukprot:SAG11_NODE_18683_length_484_cov_0.532468_1_plen_37_part_01